MILISNPSYLTTRYSNKYHHLKCITVVFLKAVMLHCLTDSFYVSSTHNYQHPQLPSKPYCHKKRCWASHNAEVDQSTLIYNNQYSIISNKQYSQLTARTCADQSVVVKRMKNHSSPIIHHHGSPITVPPSRFPHHGSSITVPLSWVPHHGSTNTSLLGKQWYRGH